MRSLRVWAGSSMELSATDLRRNRAVGSQGGSRHKRLDAFATRMTGIASTCCREARRARSGVA